MNAWNRWNNKHTVGLVQNLDELGPPWLGSIRHEELVDHYMATSALYERPQDLGVFTSVEAAQQAVERDALNLAARRAYATQVSVEQREGAESVGLAAPQPRQCRQARHLNSA
jgi:hypothetical protein